jgi:microsomal dipeptidase-like Zn-dependent dipeptidase
MRAIEHFVLNAGENFAAIGIDWVKKSTPLPLRKAEQYSRITFSVHTCGIVSVSWLHEVSGQATGDTPSPCIAHHEL